MRTSIVEDNLNAVAQKINYILRSGAYDHLLFNPEGACFDVNGDILYDIDWDDYMNSIYVPNSGGKIN